MGKSERNKALKMCMGTTGMRNHGKTTAMMTNDVKTNIPFCSKVSLRTGSLVSTEGKKENKSDN